MPLPRIVAVIALLIGLVGLGVSLPLLLSLKTSLFFLLGVSVWGFLLWRVLCVEFKDGFIAGWLWSCILHLGLLPLSLFLPALLGTQLPLPILILAMLGLSVVGFGAELRLKATRGAGDSAQRSEGKNAE